MVLTEKVPDDVDDEEATPEPLIRPSAGMVVVVAAVLLTAVVVAIRWGGDDGPPPRGETDAAVDGVQAGDQPEPLTYVVDAEAAAGTSATVTNDDDGVHTFTSDDGFFDTGPVEPRESTRLPSLPPGTYGYHCSIHPALTGELVVSG